MNNIKVDELKIPLVIGITGHIDIPEEHRKKLEDKIAEIYIYLKDKYPKTPFVLLTPLADGADRMAANVALRDEFREKITVSVPLPFDEEVYKTTFGKVKGVNASPENSIKEFDDLLRVINDQKSQYVPITIPMIFDKEKYDSLDENEQRQSRHEQYTLVGEYIAIHSHILIALYNENSEEEKGGTKEIVNKKLSGEYQYFKISAEDATYPEEGIVYSVATPRIKVDPKKSPLKKPYEIKKHFPNGDIEELGPNINLSVWDKFKDIFRKPSNRKKINLFTQHHRQVECFNGDVEKHQKDIFRKLNGYKKDDGKIVKGEIEELTREDDKSIEEQLIIKNIMLRRSAAYLADRVYQPLMQKKEKMILWLISLTVFLLAIKANLPNISFHKYLDIGYVFLAIIIYFLIVEFNQIKEKQEDYRALAEGLRVQTAWNMAHINESVALYYLSHQKNELGWIRTALRCINIFYLPIAHKENLDSERLKAYWVDEQINYFKDTDKPGKISKTEIVEQKMSSRIKVSLMVFLIVVVPIGLLNVFTDILEGATVIIWNLTTVNIFQVFFIIIPIAYVSFLKSKQMFDANDESLREYRLALDIFTRADKLLNEENSNKQNIYKNLGIEALRENSAWIITRRAKKYTTPTNT